MTTGRINQVSFYFFPKFKFADGPAVDKFFTREIVKFAIRARNPEIWPFGHHIVDRVAIEAGRP